MPTIVRCVQEVGRRRHLEAGVDEHLTALRLVEGHADVEGDEAGAAGDRVRQRVAEADERVAWVVECQDERTTGAEHAAQLMHGCDDVVPRPEVVEGGGREHAVERGVSERERTHVGCGCTRPGAASHLRREVGAHPGAGAEMWQQGAVGVALLEQVGLQPAPARLG